MTTSIRTYRAIATDFLDSEKDDPWRSAVMQYHPEGQYVHIKDYERLRVALEECAMEPGDDTGTTAKAVLAHTISVAREALENPK